MLRDITIGQYYPSTSVIHKMDPRFKIIAITMYIIGLFTIDKLMTYELVILFVSLTVKIGLEAMVSKKVVAGKSKNIKSNSIIGATTISLV